MDSGNALIIGFLGVDPGDTPGDLFSGSNKKPTKSLGYGAKIHINSPSPHGLRWRQNTFIYKKDRQICLFLPLSVHWLKPFSTRISLLATPPMWRRASSKAKPSDFLRTNSSKTLFEESINNFKSWLRDRGYPNNIVEKTLAEAKFTERKYALQGRCEKPYCPFVTQYNPLVPNHKKVLMSKWYIIEKQPLLREIFREPPIISYKRGRSLEDILVSVSGLSHF